MPNLAFIRLSHVALLHILEEGWVVGLNMGMTRWRELRETYTQRPHQLHD